MIKVSTLNLLTLFVFGDCCAYGISVRGLIATCACGSGSKGDGLDLTLSCAVA